MWFKRQTWKSSHNGIYKFKRNAAMIITQINMETINE